MDNVKNNIKMLRVKRGLSQEALASKMHVHQTAVSQWENGRANPDTQMSKNLADFFNVTIDYLLGQSEDNGGIYYANNINGSNLVQGCGSVSIERAEPISSISEEEAEILRIYRSLDIRGRAKILNVLFSIEDEYAKGEDRM